jgi:hypothetical protein
MVSTGATMLESDVAVGGSKYTSWRLCVWAGWIFLVGYLASWGILGFNIPPYAPSVPVADLYAHYVENSARIRIAMALSVFFMPFYFVFSAVISRVMQRIEGPDGPLAIVEQMGGAVTVVVGLVAGVSWMTAAFRVDERSPEMVRQLHDFGWLFFDTTYAVTTLQMGAMAFVFLSDRRAVPLIPVWASWLSVFVGFTFLMLTLLPFCYDGPFAWSGLFNYWVTLGGFFVWVIVYAIYLMKAIDRLEDEDRAAA